MKVLDSLPTPQQIDQCLLSDRPRLRGRLRALRHDSGKAADEAGRERLIRQLSESIELVQRRRALLPPPEFPAALPISARRKEIAELIQRHQVVVLCGETGSGKSTQLPKICLTLERGIYGRIGHTQPR
ncbi:MAG: hypothetical protein KDI68_12740, partial [Gammaproteobacteria bacterium]|nr:hypothetical protein [Gammaproteobacteria bacterium]